MKYHTAYLWANAGSMNKMKEMLSKDGYKCIMTHEYPRRLECRKKTNTETFEFKVNEE